MYTEEYVKKKIEKLMNTDPYIHVNVTLTKPHIEREGVSVKIVGAYRHIFQVEEEKDGRTERYSVQYREVAAGIIKIAEI